jgi:2-polyprenyl-6-hydroxyphenyl methylase/3-demethylubiquinone-9 3-methyltransferase
VQKLLDSDITVALGTDGAASNNRLNMLGELQTASLIGKSQHGDPKAVDAWTALEMATLHGAAALGLQDQLGSIEVGKAADLIALDLSGLQYLPRHDLASSLVYATSGNEVQWSWVAGKPLVSAGTLQTLDYTDLAERAGLLVRTTRRVPTNTGVLTRCPYTTTSIEMRSPNLRSWRPAGGTPNSEFKPLHDINPLRAGWIDQHADVKDKNVLDVGCGGGLLCEAMAHRGATVTGIDMGEAPLAVARLHQLESGVEVDYVQSTAEAMAAEQQGTFEVVTCLEMLEHVPDPSTVIQACADLCQPGGDLFFSTINRNPKSFLFAIVGAEYILNLLPRGTHEYDKLIKPSELARWIREAGLDMQEMMGMTYNPLTKRYRLTPNDVSVNYLIRAKKP